MTTRRGFTGGDLSRRDLQRLDQLHATLSKRNVRFYDYAQSEVAVETLASRLLDVVGSDALGDHRFVPIPRGGFIVAGMLSYLLDLRPEQLSPESTESHPVVLVDDMALTGAMIRDYLDRVSSAEVVVAHLCSHPELRSEVEKDPRVKACVAAFDLLALDDEMTPEQRETSRNDWTKRLDGRYWFGNPELVAFPWSEPDQILWDEDKKAIETGWRLISPERSLKNRSALGPPAESRKQRRFRFPSEIAYGEFDGGYLICLLPDEGVYRLDAVSGAIWGTLGNLGDVDKAVDHLGSVFDVDRPTLLEDVKFLSNAMLEAGLLVPCESPASQSNPPG